MGKTSKPLTIVVTDQALLDWPEMQAYQAQGHTIGTISGLVQTLGESWNGACEVVPVDLYLGPTAHRMSESERKWLKLAIAEARKRKYPKAHPDEEDPE
jgi:hypothetical protein